MPRVAAGFLALMAAVLASTPAMAGEGSAAFSDDPSPGYASSASTSTASSGGTSHTVRRTYTRSGPVTCRAIDGRIGERRYVRLGPIITADLPEADRTGERGSWYARYCGDSTAPPECDPASTPSGCLGIPSERWGFSGVSWWSFADAFGLGAPVEPAEVAADAYRFLPIPKAAIGFNPPGTAGVPALVNLETWLWVEPAAWAPQISEIEVCCPGVLVRVEAVPQQVIFDMGDGSSVTCPGPGTPYDPTRRGADQRTACAHTYRRSSAAEASQHYMVAAAVEWRASWSVSGAAPPGGGALPATRQASTPTPLRVGEIQSLNTSAT